MSEWVVYGKDGLTERCRLKSVEYSGSFLNERTVTATIENHSKIQFEVFDYIEYRGERFELESIPTVKKTSSFSYEYELRFVSYKYELERCEMRDIVPNDNRLVYPTPLTFSFTGDVRYLVERIQSCLDDLYGKGVWNISVADDVVSEEKNITISQQNCWNALSLVNTTYGLNFYIKGRNITIGGSQPILNHIFQYGKGNGLYEIERTSDTDTAIITKLRAYGSDRNLDYSYPKKPEWSDSVLGVSFVLSPLRLMLPSFKKDGKTDYILADEATIEEYGIREASVIYDDIYPTITGAKNSQGQPIDEIKAVEAIDDTESTFVVHLYDLGFDLESQLTTADAQISMKSGAMQGYTFNLTKIEKKSDDSYRITLGRITTDSSDTGNFDIPNSSWNMAEGDKFVFLNILMPQEYIREAENRLLERAKEYLSEYGKTNFSYNVGLHDKFLIENSDVYSSLVEGAKLTIHDEVLGISEDVTIQSISITENAEDNILPQVKITLNNKPSASTLDRIQGQIKELSETTSGTFSSQSELLKQYRKKLDKPFFDRLFVAVGLDGKELASTDTNSPIAYIKAKYSFATIGGFTMYAQDGDIHIPTIAEGLPFDNRTIWFNPSTKQIEVIGGTGGGSGEGVSNFWDLNGIPSWITNTKPTYSYSEIQGTPDLSKYALVSQIPSLSGYATEQWVLGKNYLTSITSVMIVSSLGYTPYDGDSNPKGFLTEHQDLSGYQPLITSTNKLAYALISGTPDLSVYALKSAIPSLNGYATESWVLGKGYATVSDLDGRINALINGAPAAFDTLKEIADVLQGNVNSIGDIITTLGTKADKATTLAGYGITDAKIANGVITLGRNTITPLTAHQTIYNLTFQAGTFSAVTFDPNGSAKTVNIPTTTSHLSEGANLYFTNARAVSALADTLKAYVTLAGTQTITGEKNFTGGLKVNGSPLVYDSRGFWKLEGDLIVTGGVSMYSSDTAFTPSTIMDGVVVDGVTIRKNPTSGALEFIGSVDGGTASSVAWSNITGKPDFATVATSGRYSDLSGLPTIPTIPSSLKNPYSLTFGSKTYDGSSAKTILASDLGALTSHQSIYSLTIKNSAGTTQLTYTPNTGAGSITLTNAMVGLGNVENTALSTWVGSSKIMTLGTITSGTWNGTKIANSYLANSSISISGTSVSLGGSITQAALRTALGLGSNAYTSTAYLPSSSYTASDILSKLESVDGSGSNLDADLLDGKHLSDILDSNVASATKLQTARILWGQPFDGSEDVNGNITLSNASRILTKSTTGDDVNIMQFNSNNSLTIGYGVAGLGNTYLSGNNIYIRYGASRTTGLTLNDSGNITIGSSDLASTAYKLYVDGEFATTGDMFLRTNRTYLKGVLADGTETNLIGVNNSDILLIGYGQRLLGKATRYYGGAHTWYCGTTGNSDIGMNLGANGYVGIGTANPLNKLHVVGSIRLTSRLQLNPSGTTYDRLRLVVNGAGASIQASNNDGSSDSGGTLNIAGIGQATLSLLSVSATTSQFNGNILATGGVTLLSARKLKNVTDERGLSLEELSVIKPTRFTWKDGRDDKIHIGGIADDVMKVLPEVIYKTTDDTLTMDYGNAAFAIAASLIKPVINHEERIKMLEEENKRLKEEIEILKWNIA